MKKSKLLILGVIALLLVLGLFIAGCELKEVCEGKCYWDRSASPIYAGCSNNYKCHRDCSPFEAWRNQGNAPYYRVICDCKN